MNVPKLRFKEFNDEWQKKTLKSVSSYFKSGKSIKSNDILKNAPYPVYGGNGLRGYTNTFNFDGNASLIGRQGALCGNVTYVKGKNYMTEHAVIVQSNYDNYNKFLFYILLSMNLNQYSTQSAQPGLSVNNLLELFNYFPNIQEQEKIAKFLTTVDKKITNLESIITNLENQKKGLLQQIFSQKLRFKDKNGNNYPNWEKKKITDIAITYIGLVTTMTKFYVEKGIPLIRNSDIKENKFIFNEQIFLDENFAKNNSSRQHKLNDIITVHTGDVGTSAIIDEKLVNSIGFATIVTRIKNFNKYNPKYVCWYLNSPICKSKIYTMITGDGRNNLNMKDFNKLYIPIPYLEEQTKIADFLSAFDRKLENQKAQLEHWKQIKKGLLQQMFV